MERAPQAETNGLSWFQRYCLRQRRWGLKLLRVLGVAPHLPKSAAEAQRQETPLQDRAEEQEALDLITASFDWPPP